MRDNLGFLAILCFLVAAIILALLLSGCDTLPQDIASQAAYVSRDCGEAAERTQAALIALGYRAAYCEGHVVEGDDHGHAWVEVEDNIIVDPYQVLEPGVTIYRRSDLLPWEYQGETRQRKYQRLGKKSAVLRSRKLHRLRN